MTKPPVKPGKRQLTPRSADAASPKPPDNGWPLEEAMKALVPEPFATFVNARDRLSRRPQPASEFDYRRDERRAEYVEFERASASRGYAEAWTALWAAFRKVMGAGSYVALGQYGNAGAERTKIEPYQWSAFDVFNLDGSTVGENRPDGICYAGVHIFVEGKAPGGRPATIDWFAALDDFMMKHISKSEFETKTHLVRELTEACSRPGGAAPDESTVRKWLEKRLPRLYARAGDPPDG